MIPPKVTLDNQRPANLYSRDAYPNLGRTDSLILYCRTSKDRGRYRLSPEWQLEKLRAWANSIGRPIVGEFVDRGQDGRTLGPSRKQFWRAVERAQQFNAPIVAYHWQRLCREPMKLATKAPDVDFISYLPLDFPETEVNEHSRKESLKIAKRPGAPVHLSAATLFYVFNRRSTGQSWQAIAKELSQMSGLPWDHRKIDRLVKAHGIRYECLR